MWHELAREARWLPRQCVDAGPTHIVWSRKPIHAEALHEIELSWALSEAEAKWSRWNAQEKGDNLSDDPDESFEGKCPHAFKWAQWANVRDGTEVLVREFGSQHVHGKEMERGTLELGTFFLSHMLRCAAFIFAGPRQS
jgi:hypothetical protein